MKGLFPMDTVMSTEVWLAEKFGKYDWFHSIGKDSFKYTVLYVKYLNLEVLTLTSTLERDFKVHFAGSILASSSDYTNTESTSRLPALASVSQLELEVDEVDVHEELWNLQRVCGRDNLVDIFYEVHDRTNAVTSLSSQYPEVRAAMEVLYDNAGFDVLYEELDAEDE